MQGLRQRKEVEGMYAEEEAAESESSPYSTLTFFFSLIYSTGTCPVQHKTRGRYHQSEHVQVRKRCERKVLSIYLVVVGNVGCNDSVSFRL